MKKTTFGAVLAFLFAAAGALTAAALYLYHREKELDEYERLLFSDDYEDDDYDDEDSTTYENIPSWRNASSSVSSRAAGSSVARAWAFWASPSRRTVRIPETPR